MSDKISKEDVSKFLLRFGKRGKELTDSLLRQSDFIHAIESEIGRELLKDLKDKYERLLDKLSSFDITEEEKIEFKVVKEMLQIWSARVQTFHRLIDKIKESVKE